MKKIIIPIAVLALTACGGGKDTPEEIAKKWCELNKTAHQAANEEDKKAASKARDAFEDEIMEKFKNDEQMMEKVDDAVEACEDESEQGHKDYDGD